MQINPKLEVFGHTRYTAECNVIRMVPSRHIFLQIVDEPERLLTLNLTSGFEFDERHFYYEDYILGFQRTPFLLPLNPSYLKSVRLQSFLNN